VAAYSVGLVLALVTGSLGSGLLALGKGVVLGGTHQLDMKGIVALGLGGRPSKLVFSHYDVCIVECEGRGRWREEKKEE
jgi:hypothetical protein